MELSVLINKFNVKGRLVALQPFGNGNINDTFLAIYRNTFTETQVILQRVNRNVFPKPEVIMANMHEITKHCHEKLEDDAAKGNDDRVWQMPRIVKATPFHEALQPPQPFKPLFALHHSFFSTLRIERSRASTDSQRRNWTRARLRFCSGVFVLK